MKTARNMDNLPSPSEADSLIAQKMASLSMKDREDFLFDLHGVQKAVPETPEMIQTSLQQLDFEMEQVNSKEAYEMAKAMNPDYVDNLRIKFLRAQRFQVHKAALRFSRFFELKLKLFGREKLGRDILQDDLDEHTMKQLYSGENQLVRFRDAAGRAIGMFFPALGPNVLEEKDHLAKVTGNILSFGNEYLCPSILQSIRLFACSSVRHSMATNFCQRTLIRREMAL